MVVHVHYCFPAYSVPSPLLYTSAITPRSSSPPPRVPMTTPPEDDPFPPPPGPNPGPDSHTRLSSDNSTCPELYSPRSRETIQEPSRRAGPLPD
ncbi:uncharacterized protein LOC109274952 [Panthera pardus]|uniref:Uncharacterized protein LOC109274952 n=1 Tax=Panthera pardus TaxID=9691 RepID=A0A9V1GAE7_PANPR|nr:uncharacterized protein LOC109274952 [Panthera pardus]